MAGEEEIRAAECPPELIVELLDSVEDRLIVLSEILADVAAERLDPAEGCRLFLQHVHSLKGTIQAFGFSGLAHLCHSLEDRLEAAGALDTATRAYCKKLVARLDQLRREERLNDDARIAALSAELAGP